MFLKMPMLFKKINVKCSKIHSCIFRKVFTLFVKYHFKFYKKIYLIKIINII